MSCVFIITPLVVSAWPVLAGILSATATSLGYRILSTSTREELNEKTDQCVGLEMGNSEVMTEQMKRGESMILTKDKVKIIVTLDAQKRITAEVRGPHSIPKCELEKTGQEFLNRVVQRYAYQRVVGSLKEKGFSLVEESAEEDGRIRLKVRKFE